ncbi:MAG: hypothetical protein EBR82_83370 [Caulobacteraceae bacterium]|nr:hypothetical protein [Caulobacteraceae bacterium]
MNSEWEQAIEGMTFFGEPVDEMDASAFRFLVGYLVTENKRLESRVRKLETIQMVQWKESCAKSETDAMPEQDIEFDIPARLRKWAGFVPVPPAAQAMEDAAYEVERLQRELTRAWAASRLTDAEREAIMAATGWLMWCDKNGQIGDPGRKDIETLVALLDRTK